jgi:UDP-N-acetylglucosamine 2-epimerase (non-hydrolysing)
MIGEGKKIKILSIFGTRPEAIKMAPVIRELESRPDVESRVVVTAQHREMLDQVVDTFNIKPDYDLEVMRPGQGLFDVTGVVLKGLKGVLEVECTGRDKSGREIRAYLKRKTLREFSG